MRNSSLIIVFCLISILASAQGSPAKADLRIKSTSDFEVSGDGTAEAWKSTEWFELSDAAGPMKSLRTRTKMLYSDKGVYTLFHCEDKKITSTFKKDFANLWLEDVVEIFYWTDESVPLYFEYELSPHNYELAILVPNFNGNFLGWTPWQYESERKARKATKILQDDKGIITGWMAEIFIPFELLRPLQNVPPKKGTQWRMNMYRIDYDDSSPSRWRWKPVKTNFHDYKNFGRIVFE